MSARDRRRTSGHTSGTMFLISAVLLLIIALSGCSDGNRAALVSAELVGRSISACEPNQGLETIISEVVWNVCGYRRSCAETRVTVTCQNGAAFRFKER